MFSGCRKRATGNKPERDPNRLSEGFAATGVTCVAMLLRTKDTTHRQCRATPARVARPRFVRIAGLWKAADPDAGQRYLAERDRRCPRKAAAVLYGCRPLRPERPAMSGPANEVPGGRRVPAFIAGHTVALPAAVRSHEVRAARLQVGGVVFSENAP